MVKTKKIVVYKFRDGNGICTRARHRDFNNKRKMHCIKKNCTYLEECILEDKDGK